MKFEDRFPHLSQLKVEKPCHEDWDQMTGDEQRRHCAKCQLHVVNVSALTAGQAEELLASREGRLCVRFESAEGKVLTRERPNFFKWAVAACLMLLGLSRGQAQTTQGSPPPAKPQQEKPVMGGVALAPQKTMGKIARTTGIVAQPFPPPKTHPKPHGKAQKHKHKKR